MFYKIINKINIHIKYNNKIFKTKLIKSDFKIIHIFLKLNIIKNVKIINNNYFWIQLNCDSFFKTFSNLHKPSRPLKITLKNIKKMNKKSNKLFLISTNKGILNNIEAENKKLGGFVILNILN